MIPVDTASERIIPFKFISPFIGALVEGPDNSTATLDKRLYPLHIHILGEAEIKSGTSREISYGLQRGSEFLRQEQIGDHPFVAVSCGKSDSFLPKVRVTFVNGFHGSIQRSFVVAIQAAVNPEDLLGDRLFVLIVPRSRDHRACDCLREC